MFRYLAKDSWLWTKDCNFVIVFDDAKKKLIGKSFDEFFLDTKAVQAERLGQPSCFLGN